MEMYEELVDSLFNGISAVYDAYDRAAQMVRARVEIVQKWLAAFEEPTAAPITVPRYSNYSPNFRRAA